MDFSTRLRNALELARKELLAARGPHGHWTGELSSSALSTATAVTALAVVERESGDPSRTTHYTSRIARGLDWLARNVNADGGWGDTTLSLSNISTTTLCWAAFGIAPGADEKYSAIVAGAEQWLTRHAGGVDPDKLASAIIRRYGKDRTFSVPILTTCALSGRLGSGAAAWKWVLPLPFELAALPHQFFAALRLPVVSYALPALIAIGQARHHHLPSRNPFARIARNLTRRQTGKVLTEIQPSSGGFLEATPLTSFVVMSLAGSGQVNHAVTTKGVEFLLASARADGSWPIDTNLATWATTLSVNALASGSAAASAAPVGARADRTETGREERDGEVPNTPRESSVLPTTSVAPEFVLTAEERRVIVQWLLKQQYRGLHPYTHARSGGWAWTDLPGGVPDADDTAGALLALKKLSSPESQRTPGPSQGGEQPGEAGPVAGSTPADVFGASKDAVLHAAIAGIIWLLDLQNSDGGIPTFCRGWTNLPFDRSAPDLTAHALRAWNAWLPELSPELRRRVRRAIEKGVRYLTRTQHRDGYWNPLWFGNQHTPDETNPVYGTARVVIALAEMAGQVSRLPGSTGTTKGGNDRQVFATSRSEFFDPGKLATLLSSLIEKGASGLVTAQKPDGSWGAPGNGPASVEETALAVEALAAIAASDAGSDPVRKAAMRGANWLIEKVENGEWRQPSPIGFYFAKLWYYERLYPQVFTAGALARVASMLIPQTNPTQSKASGL
ncbi:MAG TPA: prenyltransferase/squalene oxidase repeat-containing protein [Haliangiales bacterium]|nr:prenyltransferase/squalene oxidase repeat-containing protein [Haliangiales bacterium]